MVEEAWKVVYLVFDLTLISLEWLLEALTTQLQAENCVKCSILSGVLGCCQASISQLMWQIMPTI